MSDTDDVTSSPKVDCDEAGSSNFVFINIPEDIKKEVVEDEQNEKGEEEEEENVMYDSTQESILMADKKVEEKATFAPEEADSDGVNSSDSKNTDINAKSNNQAFLCDQCSISFVSPIYLEAHKNRCRARAGQTKERSTSNPAIKRRKRKARTPLEPKYKCDTCDKSFVRLNNLEAHLVEHNTEFKCDKCPYTTEHRRNLMRHVVVHFGEEEKKYSCPHCNYTAGKSSYLRLHVAKKHLDEKPHKCNMCSYETAVLDTLNKHMSTHTGQRAYACSHCYYSATKKTQLAKHLQKFHSDQE